ncbi:hypothetical protein HYPSUDRAFT_65253 [Hypholoma sublateritium FD-334 SS-4]|uniref:Protein YAE1 n=1 Tax=Hypholoma sublateritium (strain FD-334 SS-4) TaxID=945553 RepID=A0A0D2MM02_HYPSF|nr:hypothetical protein HYPSUDRAFT_65253 [Hypholoma sublateritium FD-334 SS-4]
MDDPWDEDAGSTALQDVEWSRMSSDFTNVGYREGITAGKEAASQEGFDDGFANVGVPIGHELGLLRGVSSVILSFLKQTAGFEELASEAEDVASQLSRIRFSDVMPRDLDAEEHARQHIEAEGVALDVNEEIAAKRDLEGIEDMLADLSAGNGKSKEAGPGGRPTIDDVRMLKERLALLSERLDLGIIAPTCTCSRWSPS